MEFPGNSRASSRRTFSCRTRSSSCLRDSISVAVTYHRVTRPSSTNGLYRTRNQRYLLSLLNTFLIFERYGACEPLPALLAQPLPLPPGGKHDGDSPLSSHLLESETRIVQDRFIHMQHGRIGA